MIHEKYFNCSKYLTDGSKSDFGVEEAAFLEDENIFLNWRLNAKYSIVVAELYVIYRCLLHVAEHFTSSLFNFTDSLSAILIFK